MIAERLRLFLGRLFLAFQDCSRVFYASGSLGFWLRGVLILVRLHGPHHSVARKGSQNAPHMHQKA